MIVFKDWSFKASLGCFNGQNLFNWLWEGLHRSVKEKGLNKIKFGRETKNAATNNLPITMEPVRNDQANGSVTRTESELITQVDTVMEVESLICHNPYEILFERTKSF